MPFLLRLGALVAALVPVLAAPAVAAPGAASGSSPYLEQRLDWGPCPGFARTDADRAVLADPRYDCAHLLVPLDHGSPHLGEMRIALLRQRALDPDARIGSLFVGPGGPGASGTALLPVLAGRLGDAPVARRFDLIGFDPRGVGASEPAIDCSTTGEIDAERADLDVDTSPEGVARTEAEHRTFAQRCAERVGTDVLANAGTRDVARDLRIARQVVGDARLSYLGRSYGAAVGTEYAERFPEDVRALVLDGAVDPAPGPVESRAARARGLQRAFDAFAAACAAEEGCPLGPDPSAGVQALLRPLVERPLPTADGDRVLSRTDAVTGLLQGLRDEALRPRLRDALRQLAAGDGTGLLHLADLHHDRAPDGSYSNRLEASAAIDCADSDRITDRAVARRVDEAVLELAPFLDAGRGPSDALELCASWPVPPAGRPGPVRAPGLPPVLVVSATGDPAVPSEDGASLARQLGARLLAVEHDRPVTALGGTNPCADAVTTRYLVDLRLPPEGARC